MQIDDTPFSGIRLTEQCRSGDARSFFAETYTAPKRAEPRVDTIFAQDNHLLSPLPGAVQESYFQAPLRTQGELAQDQRRGPRDVDADSNPKPSTFETRYGAKFSFENWWQLPILPKFAHGLAPLDHDTEITYRCSDTYPLECEGVVLWDDPGIVSKWRFDGEAVLLDKNIAALELDTAFTWNDQS